MSTALGKRNISELDEAAGSEQPHNRSRTETNNRHVLVPCRLAFPTSNPKHSTAFQYPHQLISFSCTPERVLKFDNSALRYYVDPPMNADLSFAYDTWIKRPEERGRLDGLLTACRRTEVLQELKRTNIVSWRGVMTKIMTAPYEGRDTWNLNVMRVGETLYFEEHTTDEILLDKEYMPAHRRLQTYYGYAFESYCTSASPDPREDPDKLPNGWGGNINTNVQWCSVVKTKLGNKRLIIGGEVDCVQGRYTGQPDTFVELKTSMNIRRPPSRDEANFEKKLLKFYFQSFLLGVPEIKVGFRTPAGKITTVQTFRTVEIPRLVRGKADGWDPNRCLSWADQFLTFLQDSIKNWSLPPTRNFQHAPAADTPPEPSLRAASSFQQQNLVGDDTRRRDITSPPPGDRDREAETELLPQSDRQGLPAIGHLSRKINDGDAEDETRRRERCIWRVTFYPGKGAEVVLLDDAEVEEVRNNEDRVGFLPTAFWNEFATPITRREETDPAILSK